MDNGLLILGRVANLLQGVASTRIPMDIDEIYHLITSISPDQIELAEKLTEEIANYDVNLDKVLILGDTNGILFYELLKLKANINWINFVDVNHRMEELRTEYFKVNNLLKGYSWINVFPHEYSETESDYDLIICVDCILPVTHGPLYAYISDGSKKLLKEKTGMTEVWSFSKHGDKSLMLGYSPV